MRRPPLLVAVGAAVAGASPIPPACGITTYNDTLGHLHQEGVRMVAAKDAADCCAQCVALSSCATWSMQHVWTPSTPCHLSSFDFLSRDAGSVGNSCGAARAPQPPPPPPPPSGAPPPDGVYLIDTSAGGTRQVFEGVEVELQSDSIGSHNKGMPKDGTLVPDDDPSAIGAPHDLVASERARFATDVVRGARTIRLAMGIFLRGLGPDKKSIVGRWPSQMAELKQLQDLSGVEGWAPEYWSPPSGWKSTKSYYSGTLASFNESFLSDFSDGVRNDVKYLQAAGLRVTWWGLQNEPFWGTDNDTKCPPNWRAPPATAAPPAEHARLGGSYSTCSYSQCNYYYAFKACAKKIRGLDSKIRIHANSARGQLAASPVAQDPETLRLVDAWTWHTVNAASHTTFGNNTRHWAYGKADFTNEMEYQPGSPFAGSEAGTVAAVNTFLNTLTFKDSPTGVIMLHAIKPTTNLESLGYGWTWWRSTGTNASAQFPDLQQNHFEYNYWNWNSVAPFTKTVPWNSVRRNVMEDTQRVHQRVVAFETPAAGVDGGPLHAHTPPGRLIIVVTNECTTGWCGAYNATVSTTDGKARAWRGYSFRGDAAGAFFNVSLGAPSPQPAASFRTTLAPNTIQWWYEQ